MSTSIKVSELVSQLQNYTNPTITLEAIADIVDALVTKDEEWLGLPVGRTYTITAPTEEYKEFDADGKAVVVRDYFRNLETAVPGDVVTVEVQPGLQPATIQKNITSLLGTVKKPKFNRFKTARTSKGILVTFS